MADSELLMEDHCDAYVFWKERGVRGRTCLHVDAHLDVSEAGLDHETLRALACARGAEEIEPHRVSNYLPWGGFHCGNYLYPALREGLVDRLIWVVPPFMPGRDPVEWARGELQNWVDLRQGEFRALRLEQGRVEGVLVERPLTLCTADNLPELSEPVLLDVDVDYLLDPDDRLWQSPLELAASLAGVQRDLTTVAYSVNGGYTPLEHRWLGPATLEALTGRGRPEWVAARMGRGPEPAGEPPSWYGEKVEERAINRGCLHFRRQEYAEARRWFKQALPEDGPLAAYLLALTDSRSGRREEAVDAFEELAQDRRLSPRERGYVQFLMARDLHREGRHPEAAAAFEKAAAAEPDNPVYLHHQGLCLIDGGWVEQGTRTLRRAIRLGPDRLAALELHYELFRLYRQLGQTAFAQAELRALSQKDVTGLYHLKAMAQSGR